MSNDIVAIEGYKQEQVELIKNTVAKGATNDELKLFLLVAQRSGLDPFSKQIYFIRRGNTGTIQTGIDGYRAIASRTKEHAGTDDAIFVEDNGQPESATVTVYRLINGQKCAFTATARWDEYKQEYNGKPSGLWAKMPYQMLAKCAESLALRKAFPNELSGLYTNEEMAQADVEVRDVPKVVEANVEPSSSEPFAGTPAYEKDNEKKLKIKTLLSDLVEPSTPANVKKLTELAMVSENYDEIISRLEIIKSERTG